MKNLLDVKKAFKSKEIKLSYVKIYKDDAPEYVEVSRQTLKNQFELPVLFYFLITIILINGDVTIFDIVLAWIFSISRYVHAYIRLTSNYIPMRKNVFTIGYMTLTLSWIYFIIRISN